jgi:hypothetical protein
MKKYFLRTLFRLRIWLHDLTRPPAPILPPPAIDPQTEAFLRTHMTSSQPFAIGFPFNIPYSKNTHSDLYKCVASVNRFMLANNHSPVAVTGVTFYFDFVTSQTVAVQE